MNFSKNLKLKPSLTVMVAAFNEAENIRATVAEALKNLREGNFPDYEIIIIDCLDKDGKDDGTAKIAEELSKLNFHIRAIHNPYVNLGYKFWQGVSLAKMEYFIWIPGDGENNDSIKEIFSTVGKADIVVPYALNTEVRPLHRRAISQIYTFFINLLFGLKIKYFNGTCIYKTALLHSLPESAKKTTDFSFGAEILARLLKRGSSYIEKGIYLNPRNSGKPKALNLTNFKDVLKNIIKLFWEIRIKKEH